MQKPPALNIDSSPELGSARAAFLRTREYLSAQIIGQEVLVEGLLIALLADGHLLVEGPPGLAKTRAVKALARVLECDFHRTQFTPDMLPADLTGSDIYRPEQGIFQFQRGPLFHNLILADEINRAPAKVQSALLEAMAERQISVGQATYALPPLFLVMATQNPIEQEGTYPLPEAQIDRFMMHLAIDYPDRATTLKIMGLARAEAMSQNELPMPTERLTQVQVFAARAETLHLHLSDSVAEYIAALVDEKTCAGAARLAIAMERGARAVAWLEGRDYVSPDDVQGVAGDALRHRLLLDYSAQARGITSQACVDELLRKVPAP